LFFTSVANADDVSIKADDAKIWANEKGQELLQTLGMSNIVEKHAKLDKMILEDINVEYVSKFVIGKYARKMNTPQKERYSTLFQRYILSLYKQFNLKFDASNISFTIDNVVEHPKFTTVTCSVKMGELAGEVPIEKIPVDFKLIRGKQNRIQAVDVSISNVSMVIEYRKRFYQMIIEEGEDMDWFLEKLYDKVLANEDSLKRFSAIN
jgi:ABC-type transporter MlaC component